MTRAILRYFLLALAALGWLVVDAAPAAAHGPGGIAATNVESVVLRVTPPAPGIEVRSIELGERLELHNHTSGTVVVFGYEGEPYLRVGADGVFENVRSPAVYLNRSLTPPGDVPPRYDAEAAPKWERRSASHVVRWHDHRAHYMGTGKPAAVRGTTGTAAFGAWSVELSVDGVATTVEGELRWVPPPPIASSLVVVVILAAVTVLLAVVRWRLTVLVVLVVLLASEIAHVVGGYSFTTQAVHVRLLASAWSILAIAVGCLAFARAARRSPYDAAPSALMASVTLTVVGGFAELPWLWRSQLPTSLGAPLARAAIVVALGLGVGLGVVAATRLRPRTPTRPSSQPLDICTDMHI